MKSHEIKWKKNKVQHPGETYEEQARGDAEMVAYFQQADIRQWEEEVRQANEAAQAKVDAGEWCGWQTDENGIDYFKHAPGCYHTVGGISVHAPKQ